MAVTKKTGSKLVSNAKLLSAGGAPAAGAGTGAELDGSGEIHRTLVIKRAFWKNPKARAKFRAVLKDLKARVDAPEKSAAVAEVMYQWCVVDGRGFWCVCETIIVGGQPHIVCHEVLEP